MVNGLRSEVFLLEIIKPGPDLRRRDRVPGLIPPDKGHEATQPLNVVGVIRLSDSLSLAHGQELHHQFGDRHARKGRLPILPGGEQVGQGGMAGRLAELGPRLQVFGGHQPMGYPGTVRPALPLHLGGKVVRLRQTGEGPVPPALLGPPHYLPAPRGLGPRVHDYPSLQGS